MGRRDCASAHGFTGTIWQQLGHTTLARAMAKLQLSHYSDDGLRHDTVRHIATLSLQMRVGFVAPTC
jgi:hypothetical protein